jgi:hypothetical protein
LNPGALRATQYKNWRFALRVVLICPKRRLAADHMMMAHFFLKQGSADSDGLGSLVEDFEVVLVGEHAVTMSACFFFHDAKFYHA